MNGKQAIEKVEEDLRELVAELNASGFPGAALSAQQALVLINELHLRLPARWLDESK